MARIDDAVSRILEAKFELGLFEHPFASADNIDQVGSAAHRAIARQAVAESQVLLKNAGDALPLSPNANIYVAGRNADNIGNQAGGWTIPWQGASGDIIPGTTILEGIREVAPQATSPTAPMHQPRWPARTSVSSSSARRRTPRATATSAGPSAASARRSSWRRSRCPSSPLTRQSSTQVCDAIEHLRGARGIRSPAGAHRPARRDGRAGRLVAAGQRRRRRRRRALRQPALHRASCR